uniref:Uncharacterized protein n=1 Tax=Arundo donax TaxID=35708 RepID=A0A0A9A3B3_ARUDO
MMTGARRSSRNTPMPNCGRRSGAGTVLYS